jgi:hypothetical protein
MKETFRDYFKRMGLVSEPKQKRLFELYHAVTRFLPEEIEEVFISQSEEGKVSARDSLWFFSKGYCLECREFQERNDLEIHSAKGLLNLRSIMENFDLQKLSIESDHEASSTMIVEFILAGSGKRQLNAYGWNCAKLAAVALEYLKPNLAR